MMAWTKHITNILESATFIYALLSYKARLEIIVNQLLFYDYKKRRHIFDFLMNCF